MARITGIGGIFVKSRDPKALAAWYAERLGLEVAAWGGAELSWRDGEKTGPPGYTVWNPFDAATSYFEPSDRPFMVNFRVDDLDGLLASLRAAGERVLDRREDGEQGKFGYVVDPDGTLLELWEPAAAGPSLG